MELSYGLQVVHENENKQEGLQKSLSLGYDSVFRIFLKQIY